MKRFCESIRMMEPEKLTVEQLTYRLNRWLKRGKPIYISNLSLFHNGYITYYDNVDDMAKAIKKIKPTYFTIGIVDKEF